MAHALRSFRAEAGPMLRLAAPLALAELGWMSMGIVDTIMAGKLGAAALGAGSLGNMIMFPVAISATGLLLGMDTLVSQAHGAQEHEDARRTLVNGVWLGLALSPLVALVLLALIPVLRAAGTNPHVMVQLGPYVRALVWGLPGLMLYAAFRRYLQAVNVVKPVMFALISANLVNLAGNWILIFGHFGLPALGLPGSGLATSFSRTYMAAVLVGAVVWHERKTGKYLFSISWKPSFDRLRRLISLGLPAAGQILFEGAVFGIVTALAARLDEASLAAHSIAVQVISFTYMVPLGISSAAAVRVGHALGRKDRIAATLSGWTALVFSAAFMTGAGIALWTVPRLITGIFIRDAAVVATGTVLLRIAALLELFDGLQVVATGALRGFGDTRSPMLAHLVFYWVIGMPVAWVLGFAFHWGVSGIWVGLTASIILIGITLIVVWARRVR
jgi:MATE family multidrug resistance protein